MKYVLGILLFQIQIRSVYKRFNMYWYALVCPTEFVIRLFKKAVV